MTDFVTPDGRPGIPPPEEADEGPIPVPTLREADEAASVAHDFIWEKNGVTKEQASVAIWVIHAALRPLIDEAKHG